MLVTIASLLFAAAGTPSVAAAPAPVAAAVDPKKMSQAEIRAHNAKLAKTDPNFIRCVRSAPIGSLIARNFSCRTVAQWDAADRVGNDEARQISDEMASKSWNQGN